MGTRRQLCLAAAVCVLLTPAVGAKPPSPTDLDWLREQCGRDAALAYQSRGTIYLAELATGETAKVGRGVCPEFSPDGSKLAWVDKGVVRGRMRLAPEEGEPEVHVIARGADGESGVHWISNDEVVFYTEEGWRRCTLGGEPKPVPALDKLGRGAHECDVKLREDGVWALVKRGRWADSTGKRGEAPGACSYSLSPDGRSVTGLHRGHKRCTLTPIAEGGAEGELRWTYDHKKSKGFDNHRWSSNDGRFVACQDEKAECMVVMMLGSTRCTRMGEKGGGEMYGDFTVGAGEGDPWPD